MRGPTWILPIELVRPLLSGADTARLVRMRIQGCTFAPHAEIELTASGFKAEIEYLDPRYPERSQSTPARLIVSPDENTVRALG